MDVLADPPKERKPHWERRYPGRFEFELDALRRAGIHPEIDDAALANGRLVLDLSWRLDDQVTLRLRAIYPDSFPHMRPQVFLRSGLDRMPARHVAPIGGNLCLLGRDSRQWMPSWSLYKLLSEQLEAALTGAGDEDPQGEPAEYWWNSLNNTGAFCLVDSSWSLAGAREGTLLVRYIAAGVAEESRGRETARAPVIRAYVEQVQAADGSVLHRWDAPLPADLARASLALRVPWVRIDEPLLPESDLGNQVRMLRERHPHLKKGQVKAYRQGLSMDLFAVVHPSELQFGETGLGWVFCLRCGHPQAFTGRPGRNQRPRRLNVTSLPALRAGAGDLGRRVPAVRTLADRRVLVVGTGAVGAPVAVELARNGCGALRLIEHDRVEPGNTVRWPLGASAWGRDKVDALQEFLSREYPGTAVEAWRHALGQVAPEPDSAGDDEVLDAALDGADLVIDGSASHGVTTLLADRCREAGIPLICLFATPTLEGGVVVRHAGTGGCPTCLEHAWHDGSIPPPPGRGADADLIQPPGCAERTFSGAGYDLQELSLQAVRLAVETLSSSGDSGSLVQTLRFLDEAGRTAPPNWRVDPLPRHPACRCRA